MEKIIFLVIAGLSRIVLTLRDLDDLIEGRYEWKH